MNTEHPITPPPELVQQWMAEFYGSKIAPGEATIHIATQAARWGADQELEACRLWVSENCSIYDAADLIKARRPKPPGLKEQALEALYQIESEFPAGSFGETIRRALEALPND